MIMALVINDRLIIEINSTDKLTPPYSSVDIQERISRINCIHRIIKCCQKLRLSYFGIYRMFSFLINCVMSDLKQAGNECYRGVYWGDTLSPPK